MGGSYELPDIPVLVDGDTLVFNAPAEPLEVKELPMDMETFQAPRHQAPGEVPLHLQGTVPLDLRHRDAADGHRRP